MKPKQKYRAIWQQAGQSERANVDFSAKDDADAIKQADRIAVEVQSTNTPRRITRVPGGHLVQSIMKGVSE